MLGMPNDITMSQHYDILINEILVIYWEQIPNYSMELKAILAMRKK